MCLWRPTPPDVHFGGGETRIYLYAAEGRKGSLSLKWPQTHLKIASLAGQFMDINLHYWEGWKGPFLIYRLLLV